MTKLISNVPVDVDDACRVLSDFLTDVGIEGIRVTYLGVVEFYRGDEKQTFTPIALDMMRYRQEEAQNG